ncbi:MAG: nucleotidyltransferase domain-containing protein [Bacteroidales bacterium]|nr:nucleotidyltransferase domain-containing protein [Bacteroidales bacterium]
MINENIKNKIVCSLQSYDPEKIILFGSYAYGNPKEGSDIDLLIVKNLDEKDIRPYRLKIKKELYEQFKNTSLYFDVIVDSEQRINNRIKIGDLFYNEIFTCGEIIYA